MKYIWCLIKSTEDGDCVYDTLIAWWKKQPTPEMMADVSQLTVKEAKCLSKSYFLTYNGKYVEYRLEKCAEGKPL